MCKPAAINTFVLAMDYVTLRIVEGVTRGDKPAEMEQQADAFSATDQIQTCCTLHTKKATKRSV